MLLLFLAWQYEDKIYNVYIFRLFHFKGQFNDYVIKLRMEYSDKVGTFRKIIEIHQTEQDRNTDYWKNCITVCRATSYLICTNVLCYLLSDIILRLDDHSIYQFTRRICVCI